MISEEIIQYLRDSAPYLTIEDASENLGIGQQVLRNHCKKHGIEMVHPAKQLRDYVKAHAKTKTLAQIATLTGNTEAGMLRIYEELGLADIGKVPGFWDKAFSVRNILSRYQFDPNIHYQHPMRPLFREE